MKLSISKKLAKLTPAQFEKWFKRHWPKRDWKEHYKSIGGEIASTPKKKKGE